MGPSDACGWDTCCVLLVFASARPIIPSVAAAMIVAIRKRRRSMFLDMAISSWLQADEAESNTQGRFHSVGEMDAQRLADANSHVASANSLGASSGLAR